MCICLRMLMCLGDVSGSREGGSGESSWAWRQQRLPGCGGRPPSGLRVHGSALGRGGGRHGRLPQPAWVGRSSTPGSRRPAPAEWTCTPCCCPLAPMPATLPMAPTTSPLPVSGVGGESFPCWAGGGKWGGFAPDPNCLGNFIAVLGDKLCSWLCLEGKEREVDRGGQSRRGRSRGEGSGASRSGKGWWPAVREAGEGLLMSSKSALQKKFWAGKASRGAAG